MREEAEVIAALRNVVFYPVQGDTAINAAIVEQFGIWGYPTFVTLNEQGETIQRNVGYGEAAEWSAWLTAVKDDPISLAQRKERFAREPRFQDGMVLGLAAMTEERAAEAEAYYRQAMTLDPQAAVQEDLAVRLASAVVRGVATGELPPEHGQQVAVEFITAETTEPMQALRIANLILRYRERFTEPSLAQILETAHARVTPVRTQTEEDAQATERLRTFDIEYALLVERDAEKALEMKRASLPEDWQTNPEEMNSFAWWSFERAINLEEAERLARQAAEMTEPGGLQANILDTVAQIVYLRGDPQEAAQVMRRAVEMDPENEYLREQLDRFTSAETPQEGGAASAS